MNKASKLLFALLISLPGLAQTSDSLKWKRFKNQFDNPYKSFTKTKIIGFQSSSLISGNRISNDFIYPFVFGKNLDKKTIDNTLDNSKNKQLLIETNYDLSFVNLEKNLFNKKKINWYLKAGNHHRTYADVSNGAMKLIFRGNTDSTAYTFNKCDYYNIRLNKIGGGIYLHDEKKARPYNLSFGLFILQAFNYGNVETHTKNSLISSEDSFELGINYNAQFASNGLGLGSEFVFNQKLTDTRIWGFRLENFGFARFNEKTTTYNANGNYKFDGLYIADISRIGEENYLKSKLDSFTNPLTNKKENQSKTIFIAPVSFVYYTLHLKSGYYQFGIRHAGTKALPVAEFRYFKFLKPSLLFGVSAGTIGQYYLITDVSWAINRHWFLQAGLFHIEALALPKTFGGLGGNYGLQFVF